MTTQEFLQQGIVTSSQARQNETGQIAVILRASYYYAYGIRNSFGMDFDPVTGNLWENENGADDNDEINLVLPGFNSGWSEVTGIASSPSSSKSSPSSSPEFNLELLTFNGQGKYRDPEFVSKQPLVRLLLSFLVQIS